MGWAATHAKSPRFFGLDPAANILYAANADEGFSDQQDTDAIAPNLTVGIEVGQPAGRLLLQLLASDQSIDIPSDPLVMDIGNEPGLFLRDIIRKMNAAEGQPLQVFLSRHIDALVGADLALAAHRSGARRLQRRIRENPRHSRRFRPADARGSHVSRSIY